MIEFDVDMGYLLEDDELDCVILNDENGEHEPMEFVPKLGSGTCENANADGYGFRFECSECGYSAIVHNCAVRLDELPNYCPGCGRRVDR